ncbi:RNA polymerase sigma factor SigE [Serinibacter salmoneus]|uniref:RNA polymerase sigma-70 factor (ECF subfamily) n=1 Tax=Serinibacter salmoneus TaxID=556530 RepID=A0A2A9CZT3_9MICO|nr:RNA polymerase sigma factor SigE [Serinibacter salmoneus]PFG19110.1 RNA polymerase sigma-70 factor (ECF subfamily) [Serinibacter salmoneus]
METEDWQPPTWDAVVRDYSPQVYRLAYRLTGQQADAEDLTQEVFLRVFRSLDRYQPGTFDGWLHRITTNLFLDQVRRKSRNRTQALGEYEADVPRAARADEPERGFEIGNLDVDVQAALAQLAPEYRAAVVLRDIEDLPYEEIADVLGISMGTVRSRIHRGRAKLREMLAHRDPQVAGSGDGFLTGPRAAGVAP